MKFKKREDKKIWQGKKEHDFKIFAFKNTYKLQIDSFMTYNYIKFHAMNCKYNCIQFNYLLIYLFIFLLIKLFLESAFVHSQLIKSAMLSPVR